MWRCLTLCKTLERNFYLWCIIYVLLIWKQDTMVHAICMQKQTSHKFYHVFYCVFHFSFVFIVILHFNVISFIKCFPWCILSIDWWTFNVEFYLCNFHIIKNISNLCDVIKKDTLNQKHVKIIVVKSLKKHIIMFFSLDLSMQSVAFGDPFDLKISQLVIELQSNHIIVPLFITVDSQFANTPSPLITLGSSWVVNDVLYNLSIENDTLQLMFLLVSRAQRFWIPLKELKPN